jgi:hypothetical protein
MRRVWYILSPKEILEVCLIIVAVMALLVIPATIGEWDVWKSQEIGSALSIAGIVIYVIVRIAILAIKILIPYFIIRFFIREAYPFKLGLDLDAKGHQKLFVLRRPPITNGIYLSHLQWTYRYVKIDTFLRISKVWCGMLAGEKQGYLSKGLACALSYLSLNQ